MENRLNFFNAIFRASDALRAGKSPSLIRSDRLPLTRTSTIHDLFPAAVTLAPKPGRIVSLRKTARPLLLMKVEREQLAGRFPNSKLLLLLRFRKYEQYRAYLHWSLVIVVALRSSGVRIRTFGCMSLKSIRNLPKEIQIVAEIVVVDDDYASEILVEQLRFRGHDVTRLASVDDALANMDKIASSDLLVLDIIMAPSPDAKKSDIYGGMASGMTVFREVRKRNTKLPILAYTATSDADIIESLSNSPNTTYCSRWNPPTLQDLVSRIHSLLGIDEESSPTTSFIVHGHDDATKLAVKNYLQNQLRFAEPIILHEQPNLGRTIIEKFEHYSEQAKLTFVILTPDDKGADVNSTDDEKRRARQNVIFELGYFLGTFGRASGRVILLYKGPLELPSDLGGVIYIDISGGIEAAGELIRRELKNVH